MEKTEKTIGDLTLNEVAEIKKYCERNCYTCTFDEDDELEKMEKICKKENPIGYAMCGADISILIDENKLDLALNKIIKR